ncbi:ATP-dependent helicase [Candidatus Woesearchaeota archaeon]|nr:ATP-dependent helicase [Candidatus Woesearchaeota archaeon]
MITFQEKPFDDEEIFATLNHIVAKWFKRKFNEFTESQRHAIIPIKNKENILVSSPSGTGKTLCAFTAIISYLFDLEQYGNLEDKVYCVYISPLRALSRDIEVNLKEPLQEMEELGEKKTKIRIAVRTGDTSAAEKQKMLKNPCHILITTPESLSIVLTSLKFKEHLRGVEYVIIDEIHSLAENKRGVQLSLNLERLQQLTSFPLTRIGLSATIAPLNSMAEYLVGLDNKEFRNCKIADVRFPKKVDLKVLCPLPDLINTTHQEMHTTLYTLLDDLIQTHRTTLIFTNTRSGTERIMHHLKERFPKKYTENIGAHHGSLSKTHRVDIEKRLKKGELKVCITSTSLELGVDIGYIDLVILLGSPKSIARGLQRIARSGHKLHDLVKGRFIVTDRDDLVECSVLIKNALERNIDRIHIPENCLDILAQEIIGIAISDKIHVDDLFKMIKRSYSYRNLGMSDLLEVLAYLSGEFIDLEERHVYAKIWHDKETGMIGRKGKMSRVIYMTNLGTIPDESFIIVKVGNQTIGHIDEGFLERLKRGDVFVLGGNKYEFLYSKGMVAQVNATVYRPPTIPSWFSEMLPLSFDLGIEIGKFRRLMEERFRAGHSEEEVKEFIKEYLYIDGNSCDALYSYFNEQYKYVKEIPNDKKIVIEYYRDEKKLYIVFHSLYGRRVNDVLSRILGYVLGRIHHRDVELGISDNGFYLSSEKEIQVVKALGLVKSSELREIAKRSIEKSEILKRRFRHCATRALMILRNYKGKKKAVGRQQVSSMILMNAVRRIDENFFILKEARREVLEDLMDIEHAELIFKRIESKEISLKEIHTLIPSPFAFNLVLEGQSDVLKIEEKMEFLRRMHERVLAKISVKKD